MIFFQSVQLAFRAFQFCHFYSYVHGVDVS